MPVSLYILGFILLGVVWYLTDPDRHHKTFFGLFSRDKTRTTPKLIGVLIPQLIIIQLIQWPQNLKHPVISIIASGIYLAGFALCVWAKIIMKANWGSPAQHISNKQSELVTTGPFRLTRNPIYVGLCMMALSASIGVYSILFPVVFLFFMHVKRIVATEEVLLEKIFGKKYHVYKQQVPRFF